MCCVLGLVFIFILGFRACNPTAQGYHVNIERFVEFYLFFLLLWLQLQILYFFPKRSLQRPRSSYGHPREFMCQFVEFCRFLVSLILLNWLGLLARWSAGLALSAVWLASGQLACLAGKLAGGLVASCNMRWLAGRLLGCWPGWFDFLQRLNSCSVGALSLIHI